MRLTTSRRNRQLIIFILTFAFFMFGNREGVCDGISVSPSSPVVGQSVNFSYTSETGQLVWDFGDGYQQSRNSNSISHTFYEASSYTIKVWDQFGDWGGPPNGSVTIRIRESGGSTKPIIKRPRPARRPLRKIVKKGTIQLSPQSPKEGEKVSMWVKGFRSHCVTYDYGDGKREKSRSASRKVSHQYKKTGSYTIRIYADCGKKVSGSEKITVLKANRSLTASKVKVSIGERVSFKTAGYVSDCVVWDFGDRRTLRGKKQAAHSYKKPGNYTVKAYDYCEKNGRNYETVHLQVRDRELKIAEIKVSLNGKHHFLETKLNEPLSAKATVRYQGTGSFRYQWFVDGKPFSGIHLKKLRNGNRVTLIPPKQLQASKPGSHEISLKILDFKKKNATVFYKIKQPVHQADIPVQPDIKPTSLAQLPYIEPKIEVFKQLIDPGNPPNELWVKYQFKGAQWAYIEFIFRLKLPLPKFIKIKLPVQKSSLKLISNYLSTSDRIKIPVGGGKSLVSVEKLVLRIGGDVIKKNGQKKTVFLEKELLFGRDFHDILSVDRFEFVRDGRPSKKQPRRGIALEYFWKFKYGFSQPVDKKNIVLKHLQSGRIVDPDHEYDEQSRNSPPSGIYEITGKNKSGTATARIGVDFPYPNLGSNRKLQNWIDMMIKRGCTMKGKEQRKLHFDPDVRVGGFGAADGLTISPLSDPSKGSCDKYKNSAMHKEYLKHQGKEKRPRIEMFAPLGGTSAVESGNSTKLFLHVSDSPSGKLHNQTKVTLYEDGKPISRTVFSGYHYKDGDEPRDSDPDTIHSGGGYFATTEFIVKPIYKRTTYTVLAVVKDSGFSHSAAVDIHVKGGKQKKTGKKAAPLTAADSKEAPWVKFDVDPSPPVVTVGQTVKLTCKVANAKSAVVFLVDNNSGELKTLYQIPRHLLAITDRKKVIRGSFTHRIEKDKHYLLLALNENGKSKMSLYPTVKKRVRGGQSGDVAASGFDEVVATDGLNLATLQADFKQSSENKTNLSTAFIEYIDLKALSIMTGETVIAEYKFRHGTKANIITPFGTFIPLAISPDKDGYTKGSVSFTYATRNQSLEGDPAKSNECRLILYDAAGKVLDSKSDTIFIGKYSRKPKGSLQFNKKTYQAGEQIILSYDIEFAIAASISYSTPSGRIGVYDIPLKQGAAKGSLKMTAVSEGDSSFASLTFLLWAV